MLTDESRDFSSISNADAASGHPIVFVDALPRKEILNPALQIFLSALKQAGFTSSITLLLAKDFLAKKQQGVPKLSTSITVEVNLSEITFSEPTVEGTLAEGVFNLKELIDEKEYTEIILAKN